MKIDKQQVELYFIQYCFMKNRNLLLKKYRKLYDMLFKKYFNIYQDGIKNHIDLIDIENKFMMSF